MSVTFETTPLMKGESPEAENSDAESSTSESPDQEIVVGTPPDKVIFLVNFGMILILARIASVKKFFPPLHTKNWIMTIISGKFKV